jgi:hypothetical protein
MFLLCAFRWLEGNLGITAGIGLDIINENVVSE